MRLALHTLLELHGCDPARLRAAAALEPILCEAIVAAGGHIVNRMFHNFSPHGVTGVVVISESHVAIHTWPEKAFAAVDIFSCSASLDHAALERRLGAALAASRITSRAFERGGMD